MAASKPFVQTHPEIEQEKTQILLRGKPTSVIIEGVKATITPFVMRHEYCFGLGYGINGDGAYASNQLSPWQPLTAYRAMKLLETNHGGNVNSMTPHVFMERAQHLTRDVLSIPIEENEFVPYLSAVIDVSLRFRPGRLDLEEVEGAIAAGRIAPSISLYRMIADWYRHKLDEDPGYKRSRSSYERELGKAVPKIPVWDIVTALIEHKDIGTKIQIAQDEILVVETNDGKQIPIGNARSVNIIRQDLEMHPPVYSDPKATLLKKLTEIARKR